MKRFAYAMLILLFSAFMVSACSNESTGSGADSDKIDFPEVADGDSAGDGEFVEMESDANELDKDVESADGDVEGTDGDVSDGDLPDAEPDDTDAIDGDVTEDLDSIDIDDAPDEEMPDIQDVEPDTDDVTDSEILDSQEQDEFEGDFPIEAEAEPEEEKIVCECSDNIDCTFGFYCDGCYCQPEETDGDEAEEEQQEPPYCVNVLCSTHEECPNGLYCDSGRCCKECLDDATCIDLYGSGYFCDQERGRCKIQLGDEDEDMDLAEEEIDEPVCCLEHTDCSPAQWCDKSAEAECGTCRYGCWRDEQCQSSQFSGTCNLDTHQCEFELPDGDEGEQEALPSSISGKIFFAPWLFDDVTSATVELFDGDPAIGKKDMLPRFTTQAGNPDADEHTYSYTFLDVPQGLYWLVVDVEFGSHDRVVKESPANPLSVGAGHEITNGNFYIGVPDPTMGSIAGLIHVDAGDTSREVRVRVYLTDPHGSLNDGFVAEERAGDFDSTLGGMPYVIGGLENGSYFVQAYFASGSVRVRDYSGNPISIDLSDENTMHIQNADIYLTQVDPSLGRISGKVYMSASYAGMPCAVKLYSMPDYSEDSLVVSATVGMFSYAGNYRTFEATNLDAGTYFVRAEISIGADRIYAPADPEEITIDLSNDDTRSYDDVNCYIDAVQPNRGSVQGTITYHNAYYDFQPYIAVYSVPDRSLPPEQIFPVVAYDPWQLTATYFVGNLDEGTWYVYAVMSSASTGESFYEPYSSNPISISLSGTKDFSGIDIDVSPPAEWGSIVGTVSCPVANESDPIYIELYQDEFSPADTPIKSVQAYDWSPGDGSVNYRMNHIDPGIYAVVAHIDVGGDGDASNDLYGEFDANPLVFVQGDVSQLHYDDVDITVYPPLDGTISGSVYVDMSLLSTPIYVELYDTRPFPLWMDPQAQPVKSVQAVPVSGEARAEFELTGIDSGTYYILAWADDDNDGERKNNFAQWHANLNEPTPVELSPTNASANIDFWLGVAPPNTNYVSGTIYAGSSYEQTRLWVEWVDTTKEYPNCTCGPYRYNVGMFDSATNTFRFVMWGMPNVPVDVWVADGFGNDMTTLPRNPATGNSFQFDDTHSYYTNVEIYYGKQTANGGSVSGTVDLTADGMDKLVYLRISPTALDLNSANPSFFEYGGGNRTIWLWKKDETNNQAVFDYAGAPLPDGDYYLYFVMFKCGQIDTNYIVKEYGSNPVHIDSSNPATKDLTGISASFAGEDMSCPE